MHHTVAIVASLASLGIASAMYYCNILSRPDSWLRGEMLAMILLSLLTGLFPMALGASLVGLWQTWSSGFSITAMLSAGTDLLAIAAVVATVVVFRALVRATHRTYGAPTNVTPLTPLTPHTPVAPMSGSASRKVKKAA